MTVLSSEKYNQEKEELKFHRKIMEGLKDILNVSDVGEVIAKLDKRYEF